MISECRLQVLLMKKLLLLALLFTSYHAHGQLKLAFQVDTTLQKNKSLYEFVNSYFNQTSINNTLWHPKYKNKTYYHYTTDWIWRRFTPKQISNKFNLEMVELQDVNDTLSYFNLSVQSKPSVVNDSYTNLYKYYLVKVKGKWYLDNCKDYDFKNFSTYSTKNIRFFISPSYQLNFKGMHKASIEIDSLCRILDKPGLKKPIEYYMCAEEDELNNLANIVNGRGSSTGYTNSEDGVIAGLNDNPSYKHEFVHAILGPGADCFFLQEGMAMLYGGGNKGQTSYQQGIANLRECYNSGSCNFNNLYALKTDTQFSNILSYSFAAACCKFIIDDYGLDCLYELYYDKAVTTQNFLDKLSQKTGKNRDELKISIEKQITAAIN